MIGATYRANFFVRARRPVIPSPNDDSAT
jgi:hypothetical protein